MNLSNLIIEFEFFQFKKKIDTTRKLWGQTSNIVISVEGGKPESNQENTTKQEQCFATEKCAPYLQSE